MSNGEAGRPASCRAPSTDGAADAGDLGPVHGYAIAARLEQVSGGSLRLNMGTLYPGLMRLEHRGFVRARWGVTDNNRKARFYTITTAGRRQLSAEKTEWDRMAAIIQSLLRGPA